MILALSVLAPLLRFLTGLCVLLLVLSFLRLLPEAFSTLKRFENRRSVLALTAILAWLLGAGATAWEEGLEAKLWLALTQGPNGELVQKATPVYFQEEMKGVASERGNQARAYFDAAEGDLASMRYREAADSYGRSVRVLPTASGHLNLGITLLYLSEFHRAEDVLLAGIQLARRKGAGRVEGVYLDAIGRAYLGQGRPEAALGSHREALEIHTYVGNPLGRANAHANIGNVNLAQGRPEEALIAHREAFALYTRLGIRLGRANALNHIGNITVAWEGRTRHCGPSKRRSPLTPRSAIVWVRQETSPASAMSMLPRENARNLWRCSGSPGPSFKRSAPVTGACRSWMG
jgi:tetratricopeptide (TPR) repeat protein